MRDGVRDGVANFLATEYEKIRILGDDGVNGAPET